MIRRTTIYGMTNAPPPLANATKGKRHKLPSPTDLEKDKIHYSVSTVSTNNPENKNLHSNA